MMRIPACLPVWGLLVLLAGCGESRNGDVQGYVEGEYLYLASPQAGRLETLAAGRGSRVAAKTFLFELEAEYERQAVRQAEQDLLSARAGLEDMETGRRPEEIAVAEAQLEQARAEAAHAATQLRRNENLFRTNGVS